MFAILAGALLSRLMQAGFYYEDNEEVEIAASRSVRRFGQKNDAFNNITDEAFIKMFRLNKKLTFNLIDLVSPFITPPSRSSALDVETKVLAALFFFATGSHQASVANNLKISIAQSSASRAITEVVDALNQPEIHHAWVKFPANIQELKQVQAKFSAKYAFPGVVGCIGCTHVPISSPKTTFSNPEAYINSKGYYSINVHLTCDSDLYITHVNACFPGIVTNTFVWKRCNTRPILCQLYKTGYMGFYFLGDSGYPLRPWLLTETNEAQPGSPEDRFNTRFRSIRSSIERCISLLKMRFQCLCKPRGLNYTPAKVSSIVNACVVLHNMCITENLESPDNLEDHNIDLGMISDEIVKETEQDNPDLAAARAMRNKLIRDNFS